MSTPSDTRENSENYKINILYFQASSELGLEYQTRKRSLVGSAT